MKLLREFLEFLKHQKSWWLTPILILVVLFVLLLLITQSGSLSPFIYRRF